MFRVFEDELFTSSHLHESLEGTLKLIKTDWEEGVLDFSIVHKDKTTTEVKIRMVIEGDSIYLKSFQAFSIARGFFSDSLEPIEFRIPQYTYTLNVPIKMKGLRSEEEKIFDDLLSSLSQSDRDAWGKFKEQGAKKCFSERETHTEDQMLEKVIPDWKKRRVELEKGGKLTAAEQSLIAEYISGQFFECLGSSNISLEGRKKIAESMRDNIGGKP